MSKIKKGNLNYDQSGRAYPDNPKLNENWDCIWENDGKYYELVGDNEHKEWEEVNIYNQIIDEVYRKYADSHEYFVDGWMHVIPMVHNKETFVNECKTDPEFSERWGLKIEERELNYKERWYLAHNANPNLFNLPDKWYDRLRKNNEFHKLACDLEDRWTANGIPTKLITLTYNNETIESYE